MAPPCPALDMLALTVSDAVAVLPETERLAAPSAMPPSVKETEPVGVTLHKPGDVRGTKRGEVQRPVTESLGEELINEGYVVLQRRRRQPTFL